LLFLVLFTFFKERLQLYAVWATPFRGLQNWVEERMT